MSKQLGMCDKRQYEHNGPHLLIPDTGQNMPPFPCVNWHAVSVPSPEPKVEPARRNDYENEKTFASMYLNDVYPLDVNPSPVKVGEPQTLEEPIGDLMYERYKKYCDTNPKPLLTYSGWIRKFLSDYDAAMAAKSGTADKPTYEELEASNTAWDIHCAELLEENTKLRKLAGKGK